MAADGADQLRPVWVAFSSHDEVGAEVRRRSDDPDLTWVDGTHPVVHAGAGSHSGAYLAGEYLVRVQPPALARLSAPPTTRARCCSRGRAAVRVACDPLRGLQARRRTQVGPGTAGRGRRW